jgi:hypothetical protein
MKKKISNHNINMPYRALTHGRISTASTTKGETGTNVMGVTDSQKKAYNSQAGVSNSGPNISQKNKLNIQSGRVGGSRPSYARLLQSDLLIPKNTFGPDTDYSPGQGKGFPTANPVTSVGSTNKFARRAIKRRAVTKTYVKGQTTMNTTNCKCD